MSSLTPCSGNRLWLPLLFLALRAISFAQPIAIATTNAPLCQGASELRLFESGGTAVFWNWSGPNGFAAQVQNPILTNPSPAAAGFYRVTITDFEGLTATSSVQVQFHQPIPMACNDLVLVSPNSQGFAEILPQTVLEGSNYNFNLYRVEVTTNTGLNLGNIVTCDYLGQTLHYTVWDTCSGYSCSGNLKVVDKTKPQMDCTDFLYSCAITDYSPDYMFNTLGIPEAIPVVTDNCQNFTLTYVDQFFNLPCALPLNALAVSSAWVRRDWRAVDGSGNIATCGQAIYFVRRHLSDIQFPKDTILDCKQPDISPANTGAPYLVEYGHNFPLMPNLAYCEINTSYQDEVVSVCDGTTKIHRTWIAHEDCPEGGQPSFITYDQFIKIEDRAGPNFSCPDRDTVSIDPLTCCGMIDLPDLIMKDNCGRINRAEAIIQTFDPWTGDSTGAYGMNATLSTYPNNNLWLPDTLAVFDLSPCLPPGAHTVTYRATDDCGNASTCSFALVVKDFIPPVVACDTYTKVALTDEGFAEVFAETFNDGSYDLCCQMQLFVMRPEGDCYGDPDEFDPTVWFCCSDIGQTIPVVMRAYDCMENYSDCVVQVLVEDKIRPVCIAPPHITVECAYFDPTLESYGIADARDNCCIDTVTVTNNLNQFDSICNRGTILRTFRAWDCAGNSSQCTQRIVTDYDQYFYLKMPDDKIVNTCDGTGNYGEPQIHFEDCELIGLSYEDVVYTVVPEGCYRIDRHWKIINWCTYNPNGGCIEIPNPDISQQRPFVLPGPIISPAGTLSPWAPTVTLVNPTDPAPTDYSIFWSASANCYEYKQMILVFDTKDPVIENCPHGVVQVCDQSENNGELWNAPPWWNNATASHNLCEGAADLSITASDACTGAEVRFRFLLFLDLDNDGEMETVVSSNNPPPAGMVYFGNALNANFTGGELRPYDLRAVPANQKYQFAVTETITGNKKTASVRWKTATELVNLNSPGILPELPYGRHKIKWLVEDGCTNESFCEHFFDVKDCKPPTVVCHNGLSVNIMPSGMIELWANDLLQYTNDNCTPPSFLKLGIRASGSGNGFPLDAEGNPVTGIAFDCSKLGSQPVELWSIDQAGNADYCETVVVIQDNNGVCSTVGKVSGALKTTEALGVESAQVEIAGASQLTPAFSYFTNSDAGGYFEFPAIPMPVDYTLTPHKDDNPTNGVTTYDLVEISRHILGIKPLGSPYRMIAADANRSNSITSFDIVELRKLILGIYTDLPHNTSWRFIDKDFVFTNPANPFQSAFPENITMASVYTPQPESDFVAVKIGDINGSVVPNTNGNTQDRANVPAFFNVGGEQSRMLNIGEIIVLDIQSAETLQGFQFTLQLNGLTLEEIQPGQNMGIEHFAWFEAQKSLTVAWEHGGEAAFKLKCKVLQAGYLRQMLSLNSRITRAEAYRNDASATALYPTLRFSAPQAFMVYTPQPNPFADKTSVSFYLPEASPVSLTLMDESGRILLTQKADFKTGFNQFDIDLQQVSTSGLIFFRLEAAAGTGSGKMIRQR